MLCEWLSSKFKLLKDINPPDYHPKEGEADSTLNLSDSFDLTKNLVVENCVKLKKEGN